MGTAAQVRKFNLSAKPSMVSAAGPTASAAGTDDRVDITRANFKEMLPAVEQALKECDFYAFDCEMTGLFLDNNREEYLDDMQDRCVGGPGSMPLVRMSVEPTWVADHRV